MSTEKATIQHRSLVGTFLLATGLFIASLLIGLGEPLTQSREAVEELGRTIGPLLDRGPVALFILIFLNNSLKALGAMLLGVFFGLPPAILIVLNGYIVGVVVGLLVPEAGYGAVLAALLPHGVIEVPAMLLAVALGMSIGREAFRRLFRQDAHVFAQCRYALRVSVRWVIPALLIAALVEVLVTPLVVEAVLRHPG